MARILIDLPEEFAFKTEVELLISHINLGGHLDNASLLGLLSDTRVRFWQQLGYKALDLNGVLAIVADAAVQYKSEAFHGETMIIELAARDFHKYGFDLVWRMSDKKTAREVARGKTGIICFSRQEKKAVHVPEELLTKLQPPTIEKSK